MVMVQFVRRLFFRLVNSSLLVIALSHHLPSLLPPPFVYVNVSVCFSSPPTLSCSITVHE